MKLKLTCLLSAVLGLTDAAHAAVTGQWDFNSGNLNATIGAPLAYFNGDSSGTTFGTATIGGGTANVMGFPACTPAQGYEMTHGIAANGGGLYVNQYTLIMDIMFPTASSGVYRGLWQTSTANGNDSDLFVGPSNGIGISGTYDGTIQPDQWHRVAFVFDMTLSSGRLKKYIDGLLVGSQNLDGLDGRWSLDPTAFLFTDEDNETAAGFVNSVQIHDVALTDTDMFALGGPTAAGIPTTIPPLPNLVVTVSPTNDTTAAGMNVSLRATAFGSGTFTYQWYQNNVLMPGKTDARLYLANVGPAQAGSYKVVVNNGLQSATNSPVTVLNIVNAPLALVTGQWDFNGDLSATCGQSLQFFDTTVQGDTSFGTTASYGIAPLPGATAANVMFALPSASAWGGYIVTHGIAPNGGGAYVNQYTVILDVLYDSLSTGWSSLWQTSTGNGNDGDAFFNPSGGLGISGQYHGALTLDVWHRVVLTYDLTRKEFSKYVDGVNLLSGTPVLSLHDSQVLADGTDGRWSMDPTALFLGDEDGDTRPVYISSLQVRSGRMTDAAVAALGTPTAYKIPGCVQASVSGGNVVIQWTGTVLESAPSPNGPWSVVSGAAHPYSAAPSGNGLYFRVRQ